jgi:serpin B
VEAAAVQQPEADLYLALVLPTGTLYCLKQNFTLGRANELLPMAWNWEIQNVPLTTLLSFSLPEGVMAGTYQWWLVLNRAGTEVANSANWLGSAHASCEIMNAPVAVETMQSSRERNLNPGVTTAQLEELVDGNTTFAFNLYQQIGQQPGNLFFSPYSISLALAMTGAGAKNNTASQMAAALGFSSCLDVPPAFDAMDLTLSGRGAQVDETMGEKFQLELANSIWGQQGFSFQDTYLDLLSEYYGAGMQLVDFAGETEFARQAINQWVENKTREKIKDLIPPGGLQSDTRMVLTNAVYFKAGWLHLFYEAATSDGVFQLPDGSESTVPMMTTTENFSYIAGNGYQAVELPYYGEELAMLVILPDSGSFPQVEQMLDSNKIKSIAAGMALKNIQLILPKFTFSWGTKSLKNALESLGMIEAFDPARADFSGMDGRQDLFIGDVLHQAFIAVDEKGTEAAAATAVTMVVTGMPNQALEVKVDRPFIFLIRDLETGTVLFVGRVENPTP